MVVVDPYEVAVLDVDGDLLGEEPVGFLVGGEGGFVKDNFTWVVVEEGPHDGVCG